jgi:ATP-dependent helicase/nuclease subunit A
MSPSPTEQPGILLTPQQERALSQARHLSVTANAGSGKTRVLVERYLSLVLSGSASVRDIVVLTYTEKAASELRRKIAQSVAGALVASNDPLLTRRLEAIRDDLASAVIGTIHAFSARLLREHPVEANIDAAFRVIEGLDQRSALDEAVNEAFRHVLSQQRASPLREAVFEAIRLLGRSFVVSSVKYFTERRGDLERLNGDGGIYHRTDADVLRTWSDYLQRYVAQLLSMPSLAADLKRIMDAATGSGAKEVLAHYHHFFEERDPSVRASAFAGMVEGIFTAKGDLRVRFAGRGEAWNALMPETRRLRLYDSLLRPVLPLVTGSVPDERHRSLLTLTRTLLALTEEAIRRYEERKTEAGQLDFEDLQLKTRALLALESVREQLQKRFPYVLVDEYQDTNELQYAILLPLLDGLKRGNLFIVGDPKQSIYSFRQANVEVFERTRIDIRRVAGIEGDLVLEESFRPLRDLAAFVNLVFSRLMGSGTDDPARAALHDQQGRYEPLTRARQNPSPGRVEILLREGNGKGAVIAEGEMVARRILGLVASQHVVYDRFEQPRPVRFGDVAVLLRTRRNLPDLEQAMIHAGVPYVVSSGVGYFQTQDIFDFYNYMEFLLNPGDDVALAGILRSPFFTVSDAELFEVAAARGGRGLWEHLVSLESLSATPLSIRKAVAALREDIAIALRYPVPELIARLVERTHYHGKIAATVRAAQAKANLEKLQQIARAYEVRGFTTLFDFVQRLKGLIDEEEREGQGTIETAGDAVQVMTVHAAKGLEFPVVILPYLSRNLNYDKEPFLHDELGIAFSVPEGSGKRTAAPLVSFLQHRSRARTEAEEQRIFYVACTRARDMLVLSVDPTRTVHTPNCRDWLFTAIAPGGVLSGSTLEFACTTKSLSLTDGRYVPSVEDHTLCVHLLRPGDLPETRSEPDIPAMGISTPRIAIEPIISLPKGEIFSATKIRTYVECPSRYFLRYVLGLPSEGGPFVQAEEDELRDREVPAELRGRIFHSVVQRLALQSADFELVLRETRAAIVREAPLGFAGSEKFADATARTIRQVIDSPIWKEMLLGVDTRTEFTISVALDRDFLTGTLDRIYQDTAGVWTIVDYKTDAVEKDGLERKSAVYWPQLEFYALLASQFFAVERINSILVFASHAGAPLRRQFTPDALQRIRQEIAEAISKIHRREFRPTVSPCPGCPFTPNGCKDIFSNESSH